MPLAPRSPRSALGPLAVALLAAASACSFGFYQGQDRPEDQGVEGPPPPADFHCDRGMRHSEDSDHDGRPDRVLNVLGGGEIICSGEDRNKDGKIDTWTRFEKGRPVEEVSDTNGDGVYDRRARDTNGDGALDLVTPFSTAPTIDIGLRLH